MTKAQKYEEAVQQLEDIVARMENDEIDVDTKADDEIQKILAEK